jgi:alkylhydroperoxidase family enzyme
MLPATFSRLKELHPEGSEELERLNAAAWASADPALLELCRLRIAQMLGNNAVLAEVDETKLAELGRWEASTAFTDAERAFLAFTEQFVISVSSITQAQVDALLEHASPEDVRSFTAALYAVELSQRLDMVATATFEKGTVP